MKINKIRITDLTPIKEFEIAKLSNIVIIAGANGSGKTRLKDALISTFREARAPRADLELCATRSEEREFWGGETLTINRGVRGNTLRNYMASRTSGGTYVGTVIQIDSDRSVQPVTFQPLSLSTPDPDDLDLDLIYFLNPFAGRWQQLVNKIYQKSASRDNKIASYVKANPTGKSAHALSANPDPFIHYQEIFAKLLPGKTLCSIDPKQPKEFQYEIGSQPLPFSTLSSGEQEVVKVVFDLISKEIKHCSILIDEPELHLHPTLAFRLIEIVKDLGDGTNQLILFTHSADLISTYYATGNVYFIDPSEMAGNQAQQLSKLSTSHATTAKAVSVNLGLFAVGKKLVFVEGKEASIDRLTYHKVAQKCFPEAYILPIGSVQNVATLKDVVAELSNAIFGVDLFMVRDRDGLSDNQIDGLEQNLRVRCLRRRHIENYFFDEDVLALVAHTFYLDPAVRSVAAIRAGLLQSARECLNSALVLTIKDHVGFNGVLPGPAIKEAEAKTLDQIERELTAHVASGLNSLQTTFGPSELRARIRRERTVLEASLNSEAWKTVFPGKPVLARFSGTFWRTDLDRVRQAYVDLAIEKKPEALQDLTAIMEHFKAQ